MAQMLHRPKRWLLRYASCCRLFWWAIRRRGLLVETKPGKQNKVRAGHHFLVGLLWRILPHACGQPFGPCLCGTAKNARSSRRPFVTRALRAAIRSTAHFAVSAGPFCEPAQSWGCEALSTPWARRCKGRRLSRREKLVHQL